MNQPRSGPQVIKCGTGIAMKAAMIAVMFLVIGGVIPSCAVAKTYIIRTPTVSAKLVQKWRLEEFVREIEENESKRALDFFDSRRSSAWPSSFLPFGSKELKELQACAHKNDLVAWYSDHWMDLDIDYICLERDGKRVWTHKMVEKKPETLADLTSEPPVRRSSSMIVQQTEVL